MPDGTEPLHLNIVTRLADIDAGAWDACAGGGNPFISHAYLLALEESGSATAETGWAPHHLVVQSGGGDIFAAVPLYLKNHSYGEYVFDWAWADAYHRAGGSYYPKLQCSVPFTPATGPRLLVAPTAPPGTRAALARALVEVGENTGVSSLHVTFVEDADMDALAEAGFLARTDQQFHWENDGYGTFDDFLAALSSRKRKALAKERRRALESGVSIQTLTGADITPDVWDTFYNFYRATSDKKWGQSYLTRDFFHRIGATMPENVVLVLARRDGRTIAGALNFRGGDALYGRWWGATEHVPFLHFEVCYYQAIDYAIKHGLKRVEAGAQGEHKLARGYRPRQTKSAHWIADPGLRAAIANYLRHERAASAAEMEALADYAPFRKGNPPGEST